MNSAYRLLRRKIASSGLPRGPLARITLYLAGIAALLAVCQGLAWVFGLKQAADGIGAWAKGLAVPAAFLAAILLFRYMRRKMLWRLRNRLIVTYVFIGVIPVVLLLLMAYFAGSAIVRQFATFLATSDLRSEVTALGAANDEAAAEIAAELRNGFPPDRVASVL